MVSDIVPPAKGGEGERCLDVCLVEAQDGPIIGAIRLNTTTRGELTAGTRLDLVAISRCITSQSRASRVVPEMRIFHAECFQPCLVPERCRASPRVVPYDFYNVMWVGWDGGVAYRKGVGRVLASYWDEQQPAEVQVTLG